MAYVAYPAPDPCDCDENQKQSLREVKPEPAAWINALLARLAARVVTVAVANKLARIAWAVMSRGDTFRQVSSAAA